MEGGGLGLFVHGPVQGIDDHRGQGPLYVPHPQTQQSSIGMGVGIGRHGIVEAGEKEGRRQLTIGCVYAAHALISPSNTVTAGPSMRTVPSRLTVTNRLPPSSTTSTGRSAGQ